MNSTIKKLTLKIFQIVIVLVLLPGAVHSKELMKKQHGEYPIYEESLMGSHNTLAVIFNVIDKTMPDSQYKHDLIKVMNDSRYKGRNDFKVIQEDMIRRLQECAE